jgi:enoyl-CoA hydratase/carnithine racemase
MEDTADLVLREDRDGVCTLTLNRPDKRNAVNPALFKGFKALLDDVENDGAGIGVVVIRGAGPSFCAGHDLTEIPTINQLGWLRMELLTLERLARLRQPVIAAVHGGCFTGGLELALWADLIVCTQSAQFADTHGKWGLVPGWGLSQRLPRRVGQAKALEMMLTCERYSGEQALAMGLANFCVPDDELDAKVEALCRSILANSWHSNGANKRLIHETDGMMLPQGVAHEIFRNEGFARDMAERAGKFVKK